jgi:hypothetical protein
MATLPAEQVTQRNKVGIVSITGSTRDGSAGETLWMSTTTLPYTVVNTKSVVSDQLVRDVMEDRIMAAEAAIYTDYDIYTEEGFGYDSNAQPLVIVGDGSEVLAVADDTTETIDMSDFVTGGYQPLVYTIGAGTIDNGTASMIGSVLQYVATSAGSDSVNVVVTDRDGNTVTVICVVTVS